MSEINNNYLKDLFIDEVKGALHDDCVTEEKVEEKIRQAQLGGEGEVDLSMYAKAAEVTQLKSDFAEHTTEDFITVGDGLKAVQTKVGTNLYRFMFTSTYDGYPYKMELWRSPDEGATWQHDKTIDLANLFTNDGGTLSGDLGIRDLFVKRADNGYTHIVKNHNAEVDYGTEIVDYDGNGNYARLLLCANTSVERQLVLAPTGRNGAVIFGEHNKPSGTYVGNGTADERWIEVGGIGRFLLIKTYGHGFAILTDVGGVMVAGGTLVEPISASEAIYQSGQLMLKTNKSVLNQNGVAIIYTVF